MSSFPLSALPRCVALRSKHDNSYLHSVHDENHGGSLMELRAGDGGLMNPRARFYLEPSKRHEGLIHVRSCYNNKYWVPQQRVLPGHGGSSRWVIGTAHEPEEDLSKPSCTLHQLIPIDGEQPEEDGSACRFTYTIHVRCCYNNKYWVPQQRVLHGDSARWVLGTAPEPEENLPKPSCTLHHIPIDGEQPEAENGSATCRLLHSKVGKKYARTAPSMSVRSMHIASHEDKADRKDGGGGLIDAFTVIDVSDQKQLPSYVAFKGDNGYFVVGKYESGYNWLQFNGEDVGDSRVLNTTFTNNDGVVRIKSNCFDQFWRASPNWIRPDSDDTTHNNHETLFRVTTGPDFVALQNLGNNKFCKRLTDWWTNCLSASADSITKDAQLQCYEPVVSRKIYDVDFRLGEAKLYTTSIDGLHSQTVKNRTSVPNHTKLSFTWTKAVKTTWSSTVSLKIKIETTIKAKVPFLVDGEVKITTEFSGSYTWGQNITETEQVTREIEVDVPPRKKVTVKAIGSNGVCDIPFSYTQKDVLVNGQEVIQEFTDGMYFGVKTSDVMFETTEEPLSGDED